MNKLLVSCMAAAFALSVTAADWFKGGSIADGFEDQNPSGGAWSEGLKFTEGGDKIAKIAVTDDAEVTFTATERKSLDNDVVTVTSKLTLSAYDEVPTFEEGEAPKAALAPVDDGTNPAYYGLVWEDGKAKFVALSGAEPKEEDVTVTIQMRKVLGQTQIKYAVDGTDLTDANGKAWLNTNVADAPTVVAYAGTGSVSTLAGDATGTEYLTAANPTISDAAGLAAVAKTAADFDGLAGQTVTLDKDIVLTGTVTPIGAGNNKENLQKADFAANAFKGTFDGGNHTISGLVLPCEDYVGLFGSTFGATIRNLKVSLGSETGFDGDTTSTGRTANYCGGVIVGCAQKTTIENCETVVAGDNKSFTAVKAAAGIVGYAGSGTTLKDCTNNLAITSTTNGKAAGLVACAQDTGSSLAGATGLTIDGCSNTGAVSGKGNGSGLVSYSDSPVTFKGENSTTTGDTVSVIYLNNGSITLEEGATFTVPADKKTVNKNAVDGLQLATVSEGVATLVKAADVTNGGSYKVMAAGATITLANVGDSITLDETLATATVTTSAASAKVTKSGNIYTVEQDLATVGFTVTIAENANVEATVKIDGATVETAPSTLTEGQAYEVTFAPVEGFMFTNTVEPVSGTVAKTDITITAPTAVKIVAKIGDTPYASFDDAIAALKDGDKILVVDTDAKLPDDWKVDEDGYLIAKVYVAEVGGVKYESYADAKTAASGEAVTILADMMIEDDVGDVNIVIASGKTVTLKNLKTGPNGASNVAWQVAGEEDAEVKPTVVLMGVAGYGLKAGAKFSDVNVKLGDSYEVWIEADNYMDESVDLEVPTGTAAVIVGNVTVGSLTGEGNIGKKSGKLILTKPSTFSGNFGSVKIALGDDATLTVPNATVPSFELGDKVLVTAAGEETTVYSVRDAMMFYLAASNFKADGSEKAYDWETLAGPAFVDAEGNAITDSLTTADTVVITDSVNLGVRPAMVGYKIVVDNNATVGFCLAGSGMTYCMEGLDVEVKAGSAVKITREWGTSWTYNSDNTFNIKDTRIHGEGVALVNATTKNPSVTVSLDNSTISLPISGNGTVNAFTGMTLAEDWAGTVVVSSFTEGMDLGAYGKAGSTVKLGADFNLDERKSYLAQYCTITGDLDLGGHTLTLNNGYSQTETDDNAYVINRLVGEGAINSTWKGSTKQFVKINNVLADDGETIAFTGTLTGLEVVLPTGYELDAEGHIVAAGILPSAGQTAVKVTAATKEEAEAAAIAAIRVPAGVTIGAADYQAYFKVKTVTGTAADGYMVTIELDGDVVTPVITTRVDEETEASIADGEVAVTTKKGLYYQLLRGTDVTMITETVVEVPGTGGTLKLTDPDEVKPAAAFYKVGVTAAPKQAQK